MTRGPRHHATPGRRGRSTAHRHERSYTDDRGSCPPSRRATCSGFNAGGQHRAESAGPGSAQRPVAQRRRHRLDCGPVRRRPEDRPIADDARIAAARRAGRVHVFNTGSNQAPVVEQPDGLDTKASPADLTVAPKPEDRGCNRGAGSPVRRRLLADPARRGSRPGREVPHRAGLPSRWCRRSCSVERRRRVEAKDVTRPREAVHHSHDAKPSRDAPTAGPVHQLRSTGS